MKRYWCWTSLALAACLGLMAGPAGAQEGGPDEAAMMQAWQKAMTPGPQHAALAQGVGTYKMTVQSWMDPSAPPEVSEGTATRTMALGGRVLEEHVESSFQGQPFEGLGRTGYDNVTGRYWSTWNDNMSTGLIVMHGEMRDDGTGTFEGESADPVTGKMVSTRIEMRHEGDKEINEFYAPGPDGKEMRTMVITYEKK